MTSNRDDVRGERGAVAIEYALLALLVAVALVAAFTALQVDIAGVYTAVGSGIDAAVN
jgi:Flp pilus assembly pilin Flp